MRAGQRSTSPGVLPCSSLLLGLDYDRIIRSNKCLPGSNPSAHISHLQILSRISHIFKQQKAKKLIFTVYFLPEDSKMVGIAFGMSTFFPCDVSPSSNWLFSKWRIHKALDFDGFQSAPRPRFSSQMAHTSTFFGKQTIWTVAVPGFPDWHPRLDAAQRVMLNFTKKKLGLFWKKGKKRKGNRVSCFQAFCLKPACDFRAPRCEHFWSIISHIRLFFFYHLVIYWKPNRIKMVKI